MPTVYIDIETLPTMRDDIKAELRANLKPPGQYKKPESIAEWFEREGAEALDQEYRKTALDGAYGEIIVIGVAIDDEDPITFSGDEETTLPQFNQFLDSILHPYDTLVVGHNVVQFDLRFMMHRYMIRGIKPHTVIRRAAQAKPWDSEKVFDTMVQWAGAGNRVSLDKLCKAFSIPSPKGDIDGSKVMDYVRDGRLEEVALYCEKDVEATRQIYKRMTFK
jgi:predicted PolB exonuclease-like 3'-5' exonuclease